MCVGTYYVHLFLLHVLYCDLSAGPCLCGLCVFMCDVCLCVFTVPLVPCVCVVMCKVLQDRDRLVRRTQLKRTSYEVLGKPSNVSEGVTSGNEDSVLPHPLSPTLILETMRRYLMTATSTTK